jgi:hypothetical protein
MPYYLAAWKLWNLAVKKILYSKNLYKSFPSAPLYNKKDENRQ